MPTSVIQPAWQTYADELAMLGHGVALWEPAPLHNYDKINIGDVGYIRQGCFHLLFSAGLSLGNRVPGVDVPSNFVPLDPGPTVNYQPRVPGALHTEHIIQKGASFGASSDISCIQAGTNLSFQSSSKKGAILLTKYKTFREDAEKIGFFREYMLRNYQSWIDYANHNGHMVNLDDILLVTGHDMTLDFAMLAFASNSREIGMEFEAGMPAVASASASVWGTWRTTMSVHHNCGPQHREPPVAGRLLPTDDGHSPDELQAEYTQCVFVRGFRIRKRARLIPTVIKAAAGPHDLGPGRRFDEEGPSLCREGAVESDDEVFVVSETPPFMDPLDLLFCYIFEKSSADVAIVHDLDLSKLLQITGTSTKEGLETLITRLSPHMVGEQDGIAFMRTSQDNHPTPAAESHQTEAVQHLGPRTTDAHTKIVHPKNKNACIACHKRKILCDGKIPCGSCMRRDRECLRKSADLGASPVTTIMGRPHEGSEITSGHPLTIEHQEPTLLEPGELLTTDLQTGTTNSASDAPLDQTAHEDHDEADQDELGNVGDDSLIRSFPHIPVAQSRSRYRLSDFIIQRTLGTGVFGRVHFARSVHNGRFYAIKVLAKEKVVRLKQVEHSKNEKNLLTNVENPFIVKMWGAFQDSTNLYLVMDFIPGGELFTLLYKARRFPEQVAKFYTAEVTLALDYLHSVDIVYRDLKPENILLDAAGHTKLTDFGFAKVVTDVTWTLCGSPDYLAPEALTGDCYNKSVDWYALGILIFELLTGRPPFHSPSRDPEEICRRILEGDISYPDIISAKGINLIKGLLQSDLSKRYGNMKSGSEDIFTHPWFSEVDWDRLYRKEISVPFIPRVTEHGDSSAYEEYPEESMQYGASGSDPHGHLFPEFDYDTQDHHRDPVAAENSTQITQELKGVRLSLDNPTVQPIQGTFTSASAESTEGNDNLTKQRATTQKQDQGSQAPDTPFSKAARQSSRRTLNIALELAQEAVSLDTSENPGAAVEVYNRSITLLREVMERIVLGEDMSNVGKRQRGSRRSVASKDDEVRRLKSIHDTYVDRVNVLKDIQDTGPNKHMAPLSPKGQSISSGQSNTGPLTEALIDVSRLEDS